MKPREYTNKRSPYETVKRADERLKRIKLLIDEIEPQVSGKEELDINKVRENIKTIKWVLDRTPVDN